MYFSEFITKASLIAVLVGTMGSFSAHAMGDEDATGAEPSRVSLGALSIAAAAGNDEDSKAEFTSFSDVQKVFLALKAELEQTKTENLSLRADLDKVKKEFSSFQFYAGQRELSMRGDMDGKLRQQAYDQQEALKRAARKKK